MNTFEKLSDNLKLPICSMERTITCKNNKGRKERNHKRTPGKHRLKY